MATLDDTDLAILELLQEDARRTWSAIADEVDLSPPAVADRVERLQDAGVVKRFTLDVDRSQLRGGVPVLVTLRVSDADVEESRDVLRGEEAVEYVVTTAERDLVCVARVPDGNVPDWLDGRVVPATGGVTIDSYDVTLLTDAEWTPSLGGTDFALACAECGNTVTSEGETERFDGERYHFCCESCAARFGDRYDRIEEGAD